MLQSISMLGVLGLIGSTFASPAAFQLNVQTGTNPIGWNELLKSNGIFNESLNLISEKSRDDLAVIRQFENFLGQDKVIETAYSRYRTQFKSLSDPWNLDEFRNQLLKIVAHNLEANSGKHSWWMGVHQFTDMTASELKAMRGVSVGKHLANMSVPTELESISGSEEVMAAPAEVDHMVTLRVTPAKNQGSCAGADIIFAAVGVTESAVAIATKRKNRAFDLSVQQVMDCGIPNFSCEAQRATAMDTMKSTIKILKYMNQKCLGSWKTYPANVPPTPGACQADKAKQPIACGGAPTFKMKQSEEELKQFVAKSPLLTFMYASDDLRKNYGGGIYDGSECGNHQSNHAVAIVGYGTEDGKDYWLIKNSWGQSWGSQGFLKLARNGGNICDISTVVFPGSARVT